MKKGCTKLDINNSYNDFEYFTYILKNKTINASCFDSDYHWKMFKNKLRDIQILLAEREHSYLGEEEKVRFEEIKNISIIDIVEDILNIMDIKGFIRVKILHYFKKNGFKPYCSSILIQNRLTNEAKQRLKELKKELNEIEESSNISNSEKIIRTNYIKGELKEIKEGPNYIGNRTMIGPFKMFLINFQDEIIYSLKDLIDLSEKKWYLEYEKQKKQAVNTGLFRKYLYDNSYMFDKENILYVHGGNISCTRNRHKIKSIKAIVNDIKGEYRINASYCCDCDIYFISNKEWEYYLKLYNHIIANFRWINKDGTIVENDNFQTDHKKSVLYLCGYNVNAQNNLTNIERQQILKKIIDCEIMNKTDIINFINFFISTNGSIDTHLDAKKKWEEDLIFVRNYNIEKQDEVKITHVQKF